MDYEKKYKEEVDRATQLWECGDITRENLEYIFPELKESEDERIRKAIHIYLDWLDGRNKDYQPKGDYSIKDMITWLEKQGRRNDYGNNVITRNDEMLQAISIGLSDIKEDVGWSDFGGIPIEEIQEWLEKQGRTSAPEFREQSHNPIK